MNKLKIKKLSPDAVVPTYGTAGAACFDLYSIDSGIVTPNNPKTFDTGLAFEVPEAHVMLVFSRSGQGFKDDIRLANCVGVIDSDYRGQLRVKLTSDKQVAYWNKPHEVFKGDRIAQALVLPVKQVEFEVVEELSSTERGEGGYGSTGK